MSLYLHLGSSGAGKSTELFKRIFEEASAAPGRNFLVIVPEQFTLQTQRDMIAMHDKHGIMNIDVLSFPRMAHRIFGELGVREPVTLEDTGKCMIVKKVSLDLRDKLGIYASKVGKQGFIEEMKSIIAEFYQYGIDDDRLDEMEKLAAAKPQLARKLRDIRIIYDGFRRFTEGRFVMNEELLARFCERIPESETLRDACICFDGFTGFTVAQLEVIDALMAVAADIHVTLTVDPRDAGKLLGEDELFYLSSKTATALTKLADRHGIETGQVVVGADRVPPRFEKAPSLAALEHGIFRYPVTPVAPDDAVRVLSCESPAGEIRFVISEIERLVNEEGLRYRDIAVVAGDTSRYESIARREFARAHIPFFIDSKRNIVGTAPVELLRAVIEVAENDFAYAGVFRFIKTGLTPITPEQSARLENYCLALNIRGRHMWSQEWTREYRTRYTLDMEEINSMRSVVSELLSEPVKVLRSSSATVNERLGALKGLLVSCEAEKRLEESADRLMMSANEEERLKGREEGQLFASIMAVFERIGMLLGDDVISLREFREILETGFKEAKLALTPPGIDTIMFGDIERSRLTSIKVLFFIGVNDGIIPGGGSDKGLLSDSDRSVFETSGIELSPTKKRSTYLSEFYLYLNLTKPSQRLYVSYFRADRTSEEARASYIIGKITKLFTGMKVRVICPGDEELLKGTDRGAFTAASLMRDKCAGELSEAERTVVAMVMREDRETYERILEAAFRKPSRESLKPDTAAALYHNVLKGSVSLLEKYAECSFAMLMNYGLKLEERRKYEIGSLELGNIYHKAIELYGRKLKAMGVLWHQTDEEQRRSVAGECLRETLEEYSGILGSSKRMDYAAKRIERVLYSTIEVLDEQVRRGDFEPGFYEESFNVASSFMELSGKIDRMDICERGGKKYLRIIDYKSGSKAYDLCSLYYGLQIQLGVYMTEARRMLEEGGETVPAGMFYYKIDDPVLEMTDRDPEKIALAKAKERRLNGPSNSNPEVIIMQDDSFKPDESSESLRKSVKSVIISADTDKEGNLGRSSKLMTSQMFDMMSSYLEMSMRRSGKSIMEGDAQIAPYRYKGKTPCEYCSYRNICGFDTKLGYRYRELKDYTEDDIWQKINGAVNSKE